MVPLTYAQFILDFPEFTNATAYPEAEFTAALAEATALLNMSRWGTLYNRGLELYIAHDLALYQRRQATAALGGMPGMAKGNLTSETPGQVALSYDTQVASERDAGYYNLTEYGQKFIRLARLRGMGGIVVNVGGNSGAVGQVQSFMAWPGPPTGNGYSF